MNEMLVKLAGLVVAATLGLAVAEIQAEHDHTPSVAPRATSPAPGVDARPTGPAGAADRPAAIGLPPARATAPPLVKAEEGFETDALPLGTFVGREQVIALLGERFPDLDARELRWPTSGPRAAVSLVLPWAGAELVYAGPDRRLGCRRHETLISTPAWAVMQIGEPSAGSLYLSEGVMVSTCQLRRGKRLSPPQRARWTRKFIAGFLRSNPGFDVVQRSTRWFGVAHAPVVLIDGINPLLGEPERNALVFLTTPDLLVVVAFVAPLVDFPRMAALVEPVVTSLIDLR